MVSDNMFEPSPAKSEAITRREIIDRRLKDAGWKIVRFDPDKPLATLDRCAIAEYPQNALTQAERYSKGLLTALGSGSTVMTGNDSF